MVYMQSLLLFLVALVWSFEIQSQIVTDGSLSPARTLSGPNYNIGVEVGRQVGNNVYHSFSDFNIHSGESATFTGPSGLDNLKIWMGLSAS